MTRDEEPATPEREVYVVRRDELTAEESSRELEGYEHGGTGISLIFVDAQPGRGPGLHRHDYDEVFIVQEGQATMEVEGEELGVRAGDIVVVPAGTPHRFVNSGDGELRLVSIHGAARFGTEWLEETDGSWRSAPR